MTQSQMTQAQHGGYEALGVFALPFEIRKAADEDMWFMVISLPGDGTLTQELSDTCDAQIKAVTDLMRGTLEYVTTHRPPLGMSGIEHRVEAVWIRSMPQPTCATL
jgi:hypothetical protein